MTHKIDTLFFRENYSKLTPASAIIENLKRAKKQAIGGVYEPLINGVIKNHVDYFLQQLIPSGVPKDKDVIMESMPKIYGGLLSILQDPENQ